MSPSLASLATRSCSGFEYRRTAARRRSRASISHFGAPRAARGSAAMAGTGRSGRMTTGRSSVAASTHVPADDTYIALDGSAEPLSLIGRTWAGPVGVRSQRRRSRHGRRRLATHANTAGVTSPASAAQHPSASWDRGRRLPQCVPGGRNAPLGACYEAGPSCGWLLLKMSSSIEPPAVGLLTAQGHVLPLVDHLTIGCGPHREASDFDSEIVLLLSSDRLEVDTKHARVVETVDQGFDRCFALSTSSPGGSTRPSSM